MDVQTSERLNFERWWIAAGFALMLWGLYISLEANPDLHLDFPGGDKLLHALGFTCLMGWWGNVFRRPWMRHLAAGGCLAYGALVEVLQAFTLTRSADVLDLLADAMGIALGLLLLRTPLGSMLSQVERVLPSGRADR